ncbi:hypothetical protein Tco_0780034 [Tanacetum coccineum]
MKQVDHYAQALSSIPAIVDGYIGNQLHEAIQKSIQSHNAAYREKAQAEKQEYKDLVDTSVRTIIREEVKTQLPQILPKVVSDFATPMIEKTVTELLEAAVLAKSSSQPKSTYEATASLSEFKLTKILIDKMKEGKYYQVVGDVFSVKRGRDEKDKDQDPSVGPDWGMKQRETGKEGESSKDPKSKSSSVSKSTSRPQHKSSSKSAHTEEPSHTVDDSGVQQDQEFVTGNTNEQPHDEAAPKTWISKVARAKDPPTSFDKLTDTPFNFSAFVINRLNINNLTQEILIRLAYEGKQYLFDLRKPLSLIQDRQGRQVIPKDYFINNDLEYLKGSETTEFYGYACHRVSKHHVYSRKRIIAITHVQVMKWYDYGYLEEIEVRRKTIQSTSSGKKKLNITRPETFRSDISNKIPYTPYNNPLGFIYHDKFNRMRSDELYKFCDGALKSFRDALQDIVSGLHM